MQHKKIAPAPKTKSLMPNGFQYSKIFISNDLTWDLAMLGIVKDFINEIERVSSDTTLNNQEKDQRYKTIYTAFNQKKDKQLDIYNEAFLKILKMKTPDRKKLDALYSRFASYYDAIQWAIEELIRQDIDKSEVYCILLHDARRFFKKLITLIERSDLQDHVKLSLIANFQKALINLNRYLAEIETNNDARLSYYSDMLQAIQLASKEEKYTISINKTEVHIGLAQVYMEEKNLVLAKLHLDKAFLFHRQGLKEFSNDFKISEGEAFLRCQPIPGYFPLLDNIIKIFSCYIDIANGYTSNLDCKNAYICTKLTQEAAPSTDVIQAMKKLDGEKAQSEIHTIIKTKLQAIDTLAYHEKAIYSDVLKHSMPGFKISREDSKVLILCEDYSFKIPHYLSGHSQYNSNQISLDFTQLLAIDFAEYVVKIEEAYTKHQTKRYVYTKRNEVTDESTYSSRQLPSDKTISTKSDYTKTQDGMSAEKDDTTIPKEVSYVKEGKKEVGDEPIVLTNAEKYGFKKLAADYRVYPIYNEGIPEGRFYGYYVIPEKTKVPVETHKRAESILARTNNLTLGGRQGVTMVRAKDLNPSKVAKDKNIQASKKRSVYDVRFKITMFGSNGEGDHRQWSIEDQRATTKNGEVKTLHAFIDENNHVTQLNNYK